MYSLKKLFLKKDKMEILAVTLEILFIILIILLIAVLNHHPTPPEHSEFYNDVSENVQLPCDKWFYYVIDHDLDRSIVEISIAVDDVNGDQIDDIAAACENLYNYIRLRDDCNKCDITIEFECFMMGLNFYFYVTYHESTDLDITSNWLGVSLDDIARLYPTANNIIMITIGSDYISHNMHDLSNYKDFKQLKSITLIGFRFTEDEENYILSVFPECDIIYGEVPPEYLLT